MVKYAKQVRKASWWVIITSILLISLDIIVVTNQALFDFMPSYGIGMIAGCLGVLAAFLGLRASKEKSAVIFFSSFKRVSILATFGAICAMGGVLWLGIIFSIHTVCLEKVDVPLHYDSLFLNQTCYNFVDDWTYENETSIDSTDDGSGEYSGDGSGEEIDIFEERFSRPALAKTYYFSLFTEIVLLLIDFIILILLAQSAGCCFCCEDNSVDPMESQRTSYVESDADSPSNDSSSEEDSDSETEA
ncbi:Oidioi.mRNA.OKI2018_I69.chr1.g1740.t1.cds [Oikopleura dioica]|uniref:Oidioi.mRNA.OKI2018_I69.chr1.g1740.t1.cds n=1 Tax=Oikopleura dioica TaxID=34765 RepID=A0ABN7SV59_OIKDI|nr:Oidioi.mRNA.OKI2018_I69.chr1.g1740.t1.cds [Oikopleura dioica]